MARRPEVRIEYPDFSSSAQGFFGDWRSAIAAAARARDSAAEETLKDIWLDVFERSLGETPAERLAEQLRRAAVWRLAGSRPVFKLGGEPALVFSVNLYPGGDVDLLAIGACYKYPGGSEDAWWTSVIEARAGQL